MTPRLLSPGRLALIAAAVAASAWPIATTAAPLDPMLAQPRLWTLTPDQFDAASEDAQFTWTSNARDSARAEGFELTLFGLPLVEAIARFQDAKLSQITASVYARGDVGSLDTASFGQLWQAAAANISKATGVAPVKRRDASNVVRPEGYLWETPAARYLLEYSFTREMKSRNIPFRAEFIRISITPPQRTVGLLESATNTRKAAFNGAAHVKRDLAGGDVWIPDVPMVDQGRKGYCAVACAERVLRYYAVAVDASELAQVANSDREGGTNVDAMMEALKRLGQRLQVHIRTVDEMDVRQALSLAADYDRAAKRAGKVTLPKMGRMINLSAMYQAMDAEVLREVRIKNKSDMGIFERRVKSYIDKGVPLLWSVELGFVPEPNVPQHAGGHMRLIIGYNSRTQEILFSDSWGAGHELKRMALADAWTISNGLTSIEQ